MATQINGQTQIRDGTIKNAQIASDAAIALSKLAEAVIQADGGQAFTADQSMGGFKLTNVATPTASTDVANKAYVDAAVVGIDWKPSVRVATTTNGTFATAYQNGSVVDGITLATGDRILLKDQTTGSTNGIYTVNATGAPTRASDADTSAEVTSGMAVFVEAGTANADSGWVLTTENPIVLGTTALVFTQFTGIGSLTAGNGLIKTGNVLDVVSGNAAIVSNPNDITLTLQDASLEIVAGGLRLKQGTAGQIVVVNAGQVSTPQTLTGDVSTVSGTGVVTLGSTIMRTANFVDKETPSGALNGVNTTFTLANTPITGSEHVYLNGLLQESGAGEDYTISGATITFLLPPVTLDRLKISYRK